MKAAETVARAPGAVADDARARLRGNRAAALLKLLEQRDGTALSPEPAWRSAEWETGEPPPKAYDVARALYASKHDRALLLRTAALDAADACAKAPAHARHHFRRAAALRRAARADPAASIAPGIAAAPRRRLA